MSQNSCCVPGCRSTRKDGVPLHRFPNPEKAADKFKTWVLNIGGELATLDHRTIYDNRRVCNKHFQDIHKYPKNKLCSLATPVLHMPEQSFVPAITQEPVLPSSDVQNVQLDVLMSEQSFAPAIPQEPVLPSSDVQYVQLDVLMSEQSFAPAITQEPVLPSSDVQNVQLDVLMSEQSFAPAITQEPVLPSSDVQNVQLDVLMSEQSLTTVKIQEPALPTTSNLQKINFSDVMTGHQEVSTVSKKIRGHVTKRRQQQNKINIISKGPHIPITEHNQFKSVLKQLKKCENDKLHFKRKYMIAKKMTKTRAFKIISKHMSPTATMFCAMQASQSGKKKQGRRFTLDEKILALSLYKPSPKAYRLLSNLCVLPSRRTLQNLLHKIDLKTGANDMIFDHLKQKVIKLPDRYKYCTLLFDEMAIGPGIEYDKRYDKIIGFVDNGERTEKEYCDHALVFMIRGVVKKYKQPVAYYFCSGSTKSAELKVQIKKIIQKVQETGLKVVATICDQGSSNMAAINMLLKETRENYIRQNKPYTEGFFEIENESIFPIFDPPHLMKGIRNNLITKNLKYLMKGKECIAKWSHIVGLYNRCPGYNGVKLVPKLTAQHVMPALIPKMRVKHCTQVFSKSVGVALGCMAGFGTVEKESTDTADLLMFFDDLFDSVNGSYSEIKNGKIYRAAVTPNSPHHKLWNYSIPVLKSMKFLNARGQGVVPSITSWIKTIEGFKKIVKYLNSKGINSLLLRNFNQDALENFFGAVRSHGCSNIMPTASAFEGAFKTLLVNNISSSHSVGSNCEKDDSVCLQSLKYFLTKPGDKTTTECEDEIDSDHLILRLLDTNDLITSKSPMHIEKSAAVGYCSGWIAQLAKKNVYKNCVTCKNDLEDDEMQSFHKFIKMKEYNNKKWLCYPTRALFDFFAQVENICIDILKGHANKENLTSYIKLIININLNVTFLKCPVHKDILAKYLINKCTMFFVNNWCKDVNHILTGKTTFWDDNDPMKEKANRHYSKHKGIRKRRNNPI